MFLLVRVCLMKIVMLLFIGFSNNLFNSSYPCLTRVDLFHKIIKNVKKLCSISMYRDLNEFEYVSIDTLY